MKWFSMFRLYLALASLIGLVGTVIGYGNIGYTWIERAIISDDEYVTGSRSYEIRSCEDPVVTADTKTPTQTIQKVRTEEEITKCKADARTRILTERAYQTKTSMIGGGVWGTLFLIVFLTHFPIFLRSHRKDEETTTK